MPTPKTDYLVALINSMTKSEKRSFKLFVMRNQSSGNILFLRLFEEMNRSGQYNEEEILKNVEGIKRRQLSNLKAHLYKQILVSLRMLNNDVPDYSIRQSIDNAKTLYSKGLYKQALELLAKAKTKAYKYQQHDLALIILNDEKLIESQYITNALPNRVEELTSQAEELLDRQKRVQLLSDLALKLYSWYLKAGYIKNADEADELRAFFESRIIDIDLQESGFYEEMYYYQSYVLYYYMQQDFLNYFKYSQKWRQAFEANIEMMEVELPIYLKAIHNVLTATFMARSYAKFDENYEQLLQVINISDKPTWNDEGLYELFKYVHLLNQSLLKGEFTKAIPIIESELLPLLKANSHNWDEHRLMVFNYKIACVYFGAGNHGKCIDFLNKIINQKTSAIRTDIQCFSRILSLIAHYELGNRKLIEYQVKSVYRFLSKMEELQKVQKAVFRFVKQIPTMSPLDVKPKFANLREELLEISQDPFENRSFLYLDIVSWLDSKLKNLTVEEIVHQKYLETVT